MAHGSLCTDRSLVTDVVDLAGMKPPDTAGASPSQVRFPMVFSTTATVRPGSPGLVAVMLVSVALPRSG